MVNIFARRRGFTLIELIIVIAIIAIIVAAVFVAMDPVKRLNTSRNSNRRTTATAIAQGLNLYITDQQSAGTTPNAEVTAVMTTAGWHMIGTPAVGCNITTCGGGTAVTTLADCASLSAALQPAYIPGTTMPVDPAPPSGAPANTTGYAVSYANGAFNVKSCYPQGEGSGGGAPIPDITIVR